jgi:viologen exporter family transport system permease protein
LEVNGVATLVTTGRTVVALAGAGFHRFATYRQATIAGAFTNTVFGFMRCYVLLSLVDAGGRVAGYDRAQLATFVFVGQGMIAVINYWGTVELADRVRTGDVVADLLRPLDLMVGHLAADVGRAAHALLTRFVVPVVAGMLAFDFYLPAHLYTYPLFVVSLFLGVLICSAGKYIVCLTAFWLLDIRGPQALWVVVSTTGSGLAYPLPLLPDALVTVLWWCTPFPSLMQAPLDVLVERGGPGHAAAVLAGQVVWLGLVVATGRVVQRRALLRLVIQGG